MMSAWCVNALSGGFRPPGQFGGTVGRFPEPCFGAFLKPGTGPAMARDEADTVPEFRLPSGCALKLPELWQTEVRGQLWEGVSSFDGGFQEPESRDPGANSTALSLSIAMEVSLCGNGRGYYARRVIQSPTLAFS